jgi:hypothetical protein
MAIRKISDSTLGESLMQEPLGRYLLAAFAEPLRLAAEYRSSVRIAHGLHSASTSIFGSTQCR